MAIRNLKSAPITQFQGKNTAMNLAQAAVGTMLSAKNVMVLADNQPRRAPGYLLVANIGTGPVYEIYDFERSVDQKQYILVHSGAQIFAMNGDGSDPVVLASGISAKPFQFVMNAFNAYGSNGDQALRFVDNAGTLTAYQWGLTTPTEAPTVSLAAGTLLLTYGRQYVYSEVSKYTDSLGIERVQVGAPSPISAHTGPVPNGVVELSGMTASTDPQVTHKWIFATTDSPASTSATFFFAAEIPDTQTSWGDELTDDQLDQTRLAPFDNNPAPPAPMLTTFQNRVVAINGNLIQLSGYDEITLGIPEESWPIDLFFNIPAGARLATAEIALNQGTILAVSTLDYWYAYSGYDASSFTEQDRVASPGAVGPKALCSTPFGIAFLSESKRLWIWNGNTPPTELSSAIAIPVTGTYSMEDLSTQDLKSARLHWYSFGQRHFLAVFCRTSDAPDANLNLIQLWSVSIQGAQSSGEYTGTSGFFSQIGGLFQTDKIPATSLTASGDVKLPTGPVIFLGDAAGNIYQFPDGFSDNGLPSVPMFSTPWMMLGTEAKKRFYWADLYVQADDPLLAEGGPVENYRIYAVTREAPDMNLTPLEPLEMQLVPAPEGESQLALRANLQEEELNVGKYLRLWVEFPGSLNEEQIVMKLTIWFAPLYQGAP